jgi:queuine tRNA-ribosyltransferase
MRPGFSFQLDAVSPGGARAGVLTTPHGSVPTPLFMPVATLASVKGVDIGRVAESGAGMVLSNTYHLHLRPGEAVVEQAGGVAAFMGWQGPTLTDSGGFQVFSLAQQVRVTEAAASFRSHLDGSPVELSPEASMRIQERIGADVAMQMDHVVALPATRDVVADAMQRSLRWAERCLAAHRREEQAVFGIVQGGLEPDLVLLFDVDLETAARRLARPLDKLENRGHEYRGRLRAGYLAEAARRPDRIAVVDATGDPATVQANLRAAVEQRFPELRSARPT